MISDNKNGNRNSTLRLLFIFRAVSLVIVLFAGIYILLMPAERMSNKNLLAGLFIAYSILRAYRLYVDYKKGHFRKDQ